MCDSHISVSLSFPLPLKINYIYIFFTMMEMEGILLKKSRTVESVKIGVEHGDSL